jgi:maltose-binding protein MalE
MFWFGLAAAAGVVLVVAALSDDSSSSSSSGGTYTNISTSTISEDSVKRKRDYVDSVIKETKDTLKKKYGAEVKISDNGNYDVFSYGEEYKRLSVMEEEILRELNELQNIKI